MKRCGWCGGTGQYPLLAEKYGHIVYRECLHPGPVHIRALPGAVWKTTKREFTGDDAKKKYREAKPTYSAPASIGRFFRRALAKGFPHEEVEKL